MILWQLKIIFMNKLKAVYIAGVARSGTSWLGQIFNSSPDVIFKFQPLFSYELKNRVNEDSSNQEFNDLLTDMATKNSEFLNQNQKIESKEYPDFKKNKSPTHIVFKENRYQNIIEPMMRKVDNLKLLGIIRNPNACLNSWMKLPKEFPEGSKPLEEWRYGDCKNNGHEDFFGYYKWKEVANLYLDLNNKWPDRVCVISYEDIVSNPILKVTEIFHFFGIPFNNQTASFLKDSMSKHVDSPYSVFKGKLVLNQWKSELDPYITNEIKADLTGTRLERFLQDQTLLKEL